MHTLHRLTPLQFAHRWLVAVLLGVGMLTGASTAHATDYPGALLFTFQCGAGAITFSHQGTAILQASLSQVAAALGTAKATGQNQLIVYGEPASVWALTSDELQIHMNANPDATKLVISAGVCGALGTAAGAPPAGYYGPHYGTATAYAEVKGTGRVIAYAQVTPYGSYAYAGAEGSGQLTAAVQTTSTTPSGRVHVVQAGETLYRISVRYGTTVSVLVRLNRLANPNVIHVGQVIALP
jgi:LysM repeat protein